MQTFTKSERLCSKVIIDEVFKTGKTISLPLFKLFWIPAPEVQEYPVQIVITVPKRNFKKAVDRNKLKRRIREAYRKNKASVYEQLSPKAYSFMLIYTGKTIAGYNEIEEKIIKLLERFIAEQKLQ